jgi:hypothetical protein
MSAGQKIIAGATAAAREPKGPAPITRFLAHKVFSTASCRTPAAAPGGACGLIHSPPNHDARVIACEHAICNLVKQMRVASGGQERGMTM